MLIRRARVTQEIREALKAHPGVVLLGPRQVGKSTLARELAKTARGETHFFDLENPQDALLLENPRLALEDLEGLLIIDEIQRNPELFPYLRVKIDHARKRTQFVLLGSASRDLIANCAETLAGRVAYIEIKGFSIEETGQREKLFLRGGYPPSFLAKTEAASAAWRKSYITSFVERDLRMLGFDLPAQTIRRFMLMLTNYHGQIFNSSEIGNSLGLSHTTTRRYLDILSGAFLIRELKPWFENIGKRQVKSPKIYFKDSGLLLSFLNLTTRETLKSHARIGAFWEGFAMEELIKKFQISDEELYFWSVHSGPELDLLWVSGSRKIGFEFKYADKPAVTPSIRSAIESLKLDGVCMIYPGNRIMRLAEKVTAVGFDELCDLKLN